MSTFRNGARRVAKEVRIKITPRPANLAESREVLRVLQRFGEVVMFKHLKHDPNNPVPNSALAIYQSEQAASSLIHASPVRFTLEPVPEEKNFIDSIFAEDAPSPASATQTASENAPSESLDSPKSDADVNAISTSQEPNQPSPDTPSSNAKRFQIVADASWLNHRDAINRSAFYGPYKLGKSMIQEDLAQRVPLVGLSAVSLGHETPWSRHVFKEKKRMQGISLRAIVNEGKEREG